MPDALRMESHLRSGPCLAGHSGNSKQNETIFLQQPSDTGDFIKDALRIVEAARARKVELRLLGATAIYWHSPGSAQIHEGMKRQLTDLDFATTSKYLRHIPDLFTSLGFDQNEQVNALHGLRRQVYFRPETGRKVDVFIDRLSFCHEIDLTRRLEIDYPTITLADLLLEKMQIVKMGEKDAKDTTILLREHEVGDHDNEMVNAKYVASVLAKDWGFYYTVTTNLNRTRDYSKMLQGLSPTDLETIARRIDSLLTRIDKEEKSFGWKMRAKVGTGVKWYQAVDELEYREQAPQGDA